MPPPVLTAVPLSVLTAAPQAAVARVEAWLAPSGDCTRGCTTTDKLHWWGRGLGDSECLALMSLLTASEGRLRRDTQSRRIQNLLLGSNDLGDQCAEAVAASAAAGALVELRALGLSRNRFTNRGCLLLARSLHHMPRLCDFFFSKQVGVDDECAYAIATALHEAPLSQLSRIGLASNNITFAGANALFRSAPPSLTEIALDNNFHLSLIHI